MVHEKKITREKKPTKEHLPLQEMKKCKSHAFKDACDQVRQQRLDLRQQRLDLAH